MVRCESLSMSAPCGVSAYASNVDEPAEIHKSHQQVFLHQPIFLDVILQGGEGQLNSSHDVLDKIRERARQAF